jgi:hypothetical protein
VLGIDRGRQCRLNLAPSTIAFSSAEVFLKYSGLAESLKRASCPTGCTDLKAKNGKEFDQTYDQCRSRLTAMRSPCSKATGRAATMLIEELGLADAPPSEGASQHGGKS